MLQQVFIELTDYCNLECTICFRHQWDQPKGEMDYSLLENLSLKITNSGNLSVKQVKESLFPFRKSTTNNSNLN